MFANFRKLLIQDDENSCGFIVIYYMLCVLQVMKNMWWVSWKWRRKKLNAVQFSCWHQKLEDIAMRHVRILSYLMFHSCPKPFACTCHIYKVLPIWTHCVQFLAHSFPSLCMKIGTIVYSQNRILIDCKFCNLSLKWCLCLSILSWQEHIG